VSKVIDIVSRLKTVNQESVNKYQESAEVVDFLKTRQQILFHERRQVKRTILSEFMSSMVVLPELGLMKVMIHDISHDGVSFDMETEKGQFKIGEEISLRVYLNQKAYFPVQVVIKHVTEIPEEGICRHGAEYLKELDNNVALQHFVKFVESASIGLKSDLGDLMTHRIS
jgi:PilZ domain